jgi:hypothetical protein
MDAEGRGGWEGPHKSISDNLFPARNIACPDWYCVVVTQSIAFSLNTTHNNNNNNNIGNTNNVGSMAAR